ncbi:TetR/AcrR family transcriptional regulator [Streptomyces purpureus]|uniref:TetR family transcriptional regulator n=1 Tax=Streptomyces purpureus TaxID=1951 RepID=A0A918LV18_9ACTN|nr:TetR/AcrR family transcriptional regulator C-terminal domain-containing protein [Streptomyces purpureus]GGT53917.1 TetR family transcriptional regulator [Streptomyces purpureus]
MAQNTLTADQIVKAAIELLDADGLDGLNMRALGNRLGSAATAVYWHVKNKDNLVRLAGDEVWKEVGLPDIDALEWREAATAMANSMHAMMTRHPWLLQALAAHLLYGPAKSRVDDHMIGLYEKAGFTGAEADQAVATVFTFVLGNAAGAAATISLTRRLSRNGGDPEAQISESLAEATEIARGYPRLRARIESASGTDYNAAPDNTFAFGLNAILNGLEQQLATG